MKWPFNRKAEPADRVEPQFQNASPENPSTSLSSPATWLSTAFGGVPSMAGPSVSEASSIRSTTVFRCVSIIAGLIASLPLSVYEDQQDGRRTAKNHRLYPLLHDAPNALMGSFIWRELITADLMLGGNHYSLIGVDNANRIIDFMPFPRQMVQPYRKNGRTRYQFTVAGEDASRNQVIDVDQEDVIHVPGLGFDGLKGISPINVVGRQPVGLDLALAEYVARMHSNGVRSSGILELPSKIDKDGLDRLRAQFESMYAGNSNVGKTMFVDKDSKYTSISLSPEDAQTLDSRRFQVADICRIFGVPPHMVGETEKSTSWGTGIEQQSLSFLRFTLEPWLKRIEDELQRKLFAGTRFYCEFDRDALLAMDSAARTASFGGGIQNGYLQPAEVRRKLNLPFIKGSDRLFIQTAMQPLDTAGQQPSTPATPETPYA
jgi:HK97 family phage portal protein